MAGVALRLTGGAMKALQGLTVFGKLSWQKLRRHERARPGV